MPRKGLGEERGEFEITYMSLKVIFYTAALKRPFWRAKKLQKGQFSEVISAVIPRLKRFFDIWMHSKGPKIASRIGERFCYLFVGALSRFEYHQTYYQNFETSSKGATISALGFSSDQSGAAV